MNKGEQVGMKFSAITARLNPGKKPKAPLNNRSEMSEENGEILWWDRLKHHLYRRRYWCLAALIIFLLEMAVFVWPVGWLREDAVNYLTGEGSWDMEHREGNFTCCQEFRPEYNHLESIGIAICSEEDLYGGNAVIVISDAKDRVLFEASIPYEEAVLNAYTDIEIEPLIDRAGQSCYLSVRLEADENGRVPVLSAVGIDYDMPENVALEQEGKRLDAQLVTRYCYKNVMTKRKLGGGSFNLFAYRPRDCNRPSA